jgi:hypothetical protein
MPANDRDLLAYLDEALPAEVMAQLEQQFRSDPALVRRLAQLVAERDGGLHALGDIWRRHRLSCPPRSELENYLSRTLSAEETTYIKFHVTVVGCRCCQANLKDLEGERGEPADHGGARRRRYFQSSVGYLGSRK